LFPDADDYVAGMRMIVGICACLLWLGSASFSAPKPHSVSFGKWTSIKLIQEGEDKRTNDLRVRPLLVDGRTKEFTTGQLHDVTERTFVVQRVYRLNDSLPQETGAIHWLWQRGGWLLVDRVTGKVQTILLPAFDPYSSDVNWFRDYAAYCGISDDGQKPFAVVAQLGRRKPVLKKALADPSDGKDFECATPIWQRDPARVIFEPSNQAKFTYTVRSRAVDLVSDSDADDGEE
jgi:hypothetical protein